MMESWSYAPDELDSFTRSRKTLMGWEAKPSYPFDINSDADVDAVENMEFMGLGYARKPFFANTAAIDSRKEVTSPTCLVTSNSFFGEDESGSRVSSSCMESNSQDSTLIDLKLGRFVDCIDRGNREILKERAVVSAVRPPFTVKRTRSTSSCSQTPLCQVYGCNKDLTSSKDYHKRHRVCEVHTKTPKVVVNGSEQRFCQQCSRFHLLVEFDDSKRSCRKRLAGHNERRRKPQFNILSSKPHKLLESYQGTKFLRTSISKGASFVFPSILPGGIVFHEKHEQSNMFKRLKLEEEPFNHSQSKPIGNCQLLKKSFVNEKQYSPGIPPWATESYHVCNASSTVPESTAIPHASCALSLLSAQSHDLPGNSAGILMPRPLINQTGRAHNSLDQNFDETIGLMSLERYATDGLYTSGMNSINGDQTGSVMVPDPGHAIDLEVKADVVFQQSNFLNAKYPLPSEHGSTVDLIQLSSHLKRVEQQRNSMQLKQQNYDLCCFPTS